MRARLLLHNRTKNEAWLALTDEERNAIESAKRDRQSAYYTNDHHLLKEKIEALNRATQSLAETMMKLRCGRFLKLSLRWLKASTSTFTTMVGHQLYTVVWRRYAITLHRKSLVRAFGFISLLCSKT